MHVTESIQIMHIHLYMYILRTLKTGGVDMLPISVNTSTLEATHSWYEAGLQVAYSLSYQTSIKIYDFILFVTTFVLLFYEISCSSN